MTTKQFLFSIIILNYANLGLAMKKEVNPKNKIKAPTTQLQEVKRSEDAAFLFGVITTVSFIAGIEYCLNPNGYVRTFLRNVPVYTPTVYTNKSIDPTTRQHPKRQFGKELTTAEIIEEKLWYSKQTE